MNKFFKIIVFSKDQNHYQSQRVICHKEVLQNVIMF